MTVNDLVKAVPPGRCASSRCLSPRTRTPLARPPGRNGSPSTSALLRQGPDGRHRSGQRQKQYQSQLRNLIHHDKLHPGIIVSYELTPDQAA